MAAISKTEPLAGFHPDRIAAVQFFAERRACLTVACLAIMDMEARRRGDDLVGQGLPVGYLLELVAVVQLRVWEMNGLQPSLPKDLPTAHAAAADLCSRIKNNPLQFGTFASATLSEQIRQLWLERFSWSAPAILGVDVMVGEINEDALVKAVAQILWNHRRDACVPTLAHR